MYSKRKHMDRLSGQYTFYNGTTLTRFRLANTLVNLYTIAVDPVMAGTYAGLYERPDILIQDGSGSIIP